MLRHLKMELKKQEALAASQQQQQAKLFNGLDQQQVTQKLNAATANQEQPGARPKRVRGRRSSKPQMEKRRRARINQCLDILKTYVLTDSTNLSSLGIDTRQQNDERPGDDENEESIARQILKSSGLINRHRGRKNPNKLEKADILELTVDYVRRLHEQRDKLIISSQQPASGYPAPPPSRASSVSHTCTSPLSLSLPSSIAANQLPSPPPSSASNSPQPLLLSLCTLNQQPPALQVLDLSRHRPSSQRTMVHNGQLMVEGSDGCWRPWNGGLQ